MILLSGLLFVYLSHRPLWHTDVWGHLAYGRVIVESGGIPQTEPLMALAADDSFVDMAWLSQVAAYAAFQAGGTAALQCLYAACIAACVLLLLRRLHAQTGSALLSLAAVGVFLWVSWQHLKIIRPQLAAMVLFTLLLVWLTSNRRSRADYWLMFGLFALWVNLHGSFPVGLVLVGCFLAGHIGDRLRQTRDVASLARDPEIRRYATLCAVAALGTLLNPYGPRIYAEVLGVMQNANLDDLVEWQPLTLGMSQGQAAAVTAVALFLLYAAGPGRVSWVDVTLLVVFGAAMLATSRMIVWWAPVAAYCLGRRAQPVWQGLVPTGVDPAVRLGPAWTAMTLILLGLGVALTPLGRKLVFGQTADFPGSVSNETPVAAVEYLRRNPPSGLLFNTYEWGDYVAWAGPRDLPIFVASHAHLVPARVWQDYLRVIKREQDCNEVFDRYGVDSVLLDKRRRSRLIDSLSNDRGWMVAHEDEVAVLLERRRRR